MLFGCDALMEALEDDEKDGDHVNKKGRIKNFNHSGML